MRRERETAAWRGAAPREADWRKGALKERKGTKREVQLGKAGKEWPGGGLGVGGGSCAARESGAPLP